MSFSNKTIIVIAGVEGGGVTLFGEKRTDGTWYFFRSYSDQTPLMLDKPAIERQSPLLASWEDALNDLDKQGWYRLPAVRVHPEFRALVWEAMQSRLPAERTSAHAKRLWERWRERCGIGLTENRS